MDDERAGGGAAFYFVDLGHGFGVQGVGTQAVDGFGGEGYEATSSEEFGGSGDL